MKRCVQKRQVVAQVGACVSRNGRPGVRLGSPRRQRRSLMTTAKLTTRTNLRCRRSGSNFFAGLSQHHVGCRSRDHKMWTFVVEGGAPSCHPRSWVVNANQLLVVATGMIRGLPVFMDLQADSARIADAVPLRFGFCRRLKIGESRAHSPPSTTPRPSCPSDRRQPRIADKRSADRSPTTSTP
jgi:hypothetical protein